MSRLEGWESRLADLIDANRRTPFAWGRFDCCLFAADAVRAVSGVDLAAGWRGEYDDQAGARFVVDQLGGDVPALAARVCAGAGFPAIPAMTAQRGDLVVLERARIARGFGGAAGVVIGAEVAVPAADRGFWFTPIVPTDLAWRV